MIGMYLMFVVIWHPGHFTSNRYYSLPTGRLRLGIFIWWFLGYWTRRSPSWRTFDLACDDCGLYRSRAHPNSADWWKFCRIGFWTRLPSPWHMLGLAGDDWGLYRSRARLNSADWYYFYTHWICCWWNFGPAPGWRLIIIGLEVCPHWIYCCQHTAFETRTLFLTTVWTLISLYTGWAS